MARKRDYKRQRPQRYGDQSALIDLLDRQERKNKAHGSCRGYGRTTDAMEQITEPEPTDAQPGSEAKILVMRARASKHQHLHHPEDPKCAWYLHVD